MTSKLEAAKRLVARGSDLGDRVEALGAAADAARGRLDATLVEEAAEVAERAASRLRLSADHTVVGIAGATGSGKSSTFNRLTELDLAAVGVRRPTTSWATACVWGHDGAEELLDHLGIPPRHATTRDSMLDARSRTGAEFDGVVLIDLPDHDSTEVSHHLEVDRLVKHADLLVWVLDPQKYADAAIHDRYLAPYQTHADVMVVVLNHIDRVPAAQREGMMADVRRLLEADGLPTVPVYATSALTGEGIPELKAEIAKRVSAKKAVKKRLEADVRSVAVRMDEACGHANPPELTAQRVAGLEDALAESAGVPTVVDAIRRATKLRARRATGWPITSWVTRLRPDPLKRLHLDLGREGKQLTRAARTSMPTATPVQRARVDSEVRRLADEVAAPLTPPWQEAVRRASVARVEEVGDRLDAELSGTDLGVDRLPIWAGLVRVLQWLLILVALVGLVWTVAVAASSTMVDDLLGGWDTPTYLDIALPIWMILGGIGLGIVLALLCRMLVAVTAKRRARTADRRLRAGVHKVADELVLVPIRKELDAYRVTRTGLDAALK